MIELTSDKLLHIERISADPEKRELASALIAEMDKPKVWDGSPYWAVLANVFYVSESDGGQCKATNKQFTRKLPKSRIDEIAEEAANKWTGGKKALEDAIKSAILQARKEWEAER